MPDKEREDRAQLGRTVCEQLAIAIGGEDKKGWVKEALLRFIPDLKYRIKYSRHMRHDPKTTRGMLKATDRLIKQLDRNLKHPAVLKDILVNDNRMLCEREMFVAHRWIAKRLKMALQAKSAKPTSPQIYCAMVIAALWRECRLQVPRLNGKEEHEACETLWLLAGERPHSPYKQGQRRSANSDRDDFDENLEGTFPAWRDALREAVKLLDKPFGRAIVAEVRRKVVLMPARERPPDETRQERWYGATAAGEISSR